MSVGLRSVCVCVRDCYAFHSVCVMPPVKLACARGSGIRSVRRGSDRSDRVQTSSQRKDDHLLDHLLKTPTRGDSQSSVPLRILRILRLRKVLSDISCLTINILALIRTAPASLIATTNYITL